MRLPHGQFGVWLEAEFEWSDQTALNFMSVAKRFPQIPNGLEFAPRALYLLSAPSTPESARVEAIDRAKLGQPSTLARSAMARSLRSGHQPSASVTARRLSLLYAVNGVRATPPRTRSKRPSAS